MKPTNKKTISVTADQPEPPNVKAILDMLVAVARTAHAACDNGEGRIRGVTLQPDDFNALSATLDALDKLPEPPGEAATGPRKAEYWSACELLKSHAELYPRP